MNVIISIIILIFSSNISLVLTSKTDDFKLELVQVLFRHGDRIPEKGEIYKTDPYDPRFYEEPGYGHLTKIGMKREYKVGQILRKRYDDFLGEYKHDEVYAYSTETDRTKMSLQLVLAGLYPPSSKTSWNNEIYWSPIPTHYKPFGQDFLSLSISGKCALWFIIMLRAAEKSPEIVKRFEEYNDFSKYIVNKTLITNKRLLTLTMIHNNLNCITHMGLPLPDWCTEEHYSKLQEIAMICFDAFVHTEAMRQIAAGPIVEEFLKNLNNSENGTDKRKIYLYSSHDINIASFTRALNVTDIPKIPTFGTALMFEKLRGRDNEVYIRMMLWTGVAETLIPLKLKCGYVCLLSEYVKMVESVVPNGDVKHCMSSDIPYGKVNTRKMKVNPAAAYSYLLAGKDLLSFKYVEQAFMQ